MRIGFVDELSKYWNHRLAARCDKVLMINKSEMTKAVFLELIETHSGHQLVFPNIQEIGLPLSQLLPAFKHIIDQQEIIYFLEKGPAFQLSDQAYFSILYDISLTEDNIFRERVAHSLTTAKGKGVQIGRPTISNSQIEEIRYLCHVENKTIREIADECDVSVGTAFKYANADR